MPVADVRKAHTRRGKRIEPVLRWLVALSSVGVAGYALVRYFGFPPTSGHFSERLTLLQIHAGGGAVALLTGPWQFWTKFRERNYALHRWLGRVYLVAVLVSSLAGVGLAFCSEEGWATHAGFGLLAVVWFATGWMAYSEARAGHFAAHRRWSLRNFSLTFAAVTLRNELPLLIFVGHLSFRQAYIAVAWLSWILNLAFAEWWIRRGKWGGYFRRR